MDNGQNNSPDIIKLLGFISICLASIYYALGIAKSLNIVYSLIIIIAIIVGGLIIFKKVPVKFPSITIFIAVVTMFIVLLAIVGAAIHLELIVEIASRLEPSLPILIILEITLLIINPLIHFTMPPEPKPSIKKESVEDVKQSIKGLLPQHWNVPYQRNLNFNGRETDLEKLQSMLDSDQSDAWKVAICGHEGVGKTHLAIEYSFRKIAKYETIWWIRSESQQTLASDYADLAAELDLPATAKGYTDQSVVIKAVKRWLEHNSSWLLIFDNAQSQKDLINYLPQGGAGHVIITSRNQFWSSIAKSLPVNVFDRTEAIDFLCRRTKQDDKKAADTIAKELSYVPMALEQASAYIERTCITLLEYQRLFQLQPKEIMDYSQSVATGSLSMDRVREESPVAAGLLNLCAFLDPDNIPLKIFSEGIQHLPESLATTVADPLALNESIEVLKRYSLVKVSEKSLAGMPEKTLSIHRIVQTVIRSRLENGNIWAEATLRIISDAFPIKGDDPESIDMQKWLDCSQLLPHALATSKHAEILGVAPGLRSKILNQVGSYLREISDLNKAKELHEKALKLAEDYYGQNHPCAAICFENLGRVLRDLGELNVAKENYDKALMIDKDFYKDQNNPHIAICEDGLGRVLFERNELAFAKEHFECALKIDEFIHGPNNFKVAIRFNNIGIVLHNQGYLEAAKEHYEKAIKIDETFYGKNHPYVAIRLNNIGTVLHDQKYLEAAKEHFEKAIKINEAFYGPDNIHITASLNNLGCVLLDMGNLKGAEFNFNRGLNILEKVYGPVHPELDKILCNLSCLLPIRPNKMIAKKCYDRVMQISHNSQRKDDPYLAIMKKNLKLYNSPAVSLLLSIFHPIFIFFIMYKKLRYKKTMR